MGRNFWKRLLLTLCCMAVLNGGVSAAVTLRFRQKPNRIKGIYLVEEDLEIVSTFLVIHRGDASSYFITFSPGQSGSFTSRQLSDPTGNTMDYQLYDNGVRRNILKDLSANPSGAEVLGGSFPWSKKFQYQSVSFTVLVPASQFPVAGRYTDVITMKLYRGTPAHPITMVKAVSFKIIITMNPILTLSLVPSGAPFSDISTSLVFDYGILQRNSTRDGDLVIRSNTPYAVYVHSANAGAMRITDPLDTSRVPYSFAVNGVVVDLTTGAEQLIAAAVSPSDYSGRRYNLSVTINDFGMATEGSYSDVLTFSVVAN